MSVNLTILFLSIDVVLVIKNPFFPKEWRVRMVYLPTIVFVSLCFAFLLVGIRDSNDPS